VAAPSGGFAVPSRVGSTPQVKEHVVRGPRRRRLRALLAAAATVAAAAVAPTVAGVVTAPPALALENGLARTPPMGFNNWNATHCEADFNEAMIKGIADIFVSRGLREAGYQYVNIDDCWALPQRNSQGNLVPDPVRFPNGIKALADYVHARGLKFGIYTSAGTKTCNVAGFPGALGHEYQDAALFASWGVDYLKYDNCNNQGVDAIQRYTTMRDALAATGRPITYSIVEWGSSDPKVWTWGADVGNLWRTSGDISDSWSRMISRVHINDDLAQFAGPGHWNDPDMLEVGNGGMTATEYRTHFSLWAVMAAPLLIGSDLRSVSTDTFTILSNSDVIAVDQDPLGRQGTIVSSSGGLVVYTKPLSNGDRAVVLLNENTTSATVSTTAAAIGIPSASSYTLKNLWTKATSTTTGSISASVPAHGVVMYRVSRNVPLVPPPAGTSQLSDLSWTSATNGWGPVEKDMSVGGQAAGDGRTLTLNGVTYAKGLGAHAYGEISYHLGGQCTAVEADVGIDDETTAGSVVFQIWRDSTKVADSGVKTGAQGATRLAADVTGGTTLRLVATDASDGISNDHADWANARVTCAPPANRYEAENATISQGVVESNHLGFSGTGFVNYDNVTGSYVQWTVNASGAGTAVLRLRYANGTTTNRPMDITVNGVLVADELAFGSTGSWDDWQTATLTAALNSGANTVRATATTVNGGPNADYLEALPPPIRYEAENATISQGVVESNHLGFSGTGFVNYDNVTGSYVQWTVNATSAGSATLRLRYANGTTTNRPMDITVNGALVADELAFPSTGSWDDWQTAALTVTLNAGSNSVRATATTVNGGPNADYLEVQL
jgi:alpha-galactosidase